MRLVVGLLVGVAVAIAFWPQSSHAQPKSKTKYTYYTISGNSARKLYQQMISRGPHVGRDRALAATSVTTRQTGDLKGRSSCRVSNYRLSLDFTIRLPRVKNEKALPGSVRRRWRAFYKFVRRHEQRHRAIWIGCARNIERRIQKLRAKSCKQLDRKASGIFKSMSATCEKKHDAFDAGEQKRLARHPLVVAAKRVRKSRKTNGLSARRKNSAQRQTRAIFRGRAADGF